VNANQIVEKAQKEAGLSSFHSETFREGLEILTSDVNRAGWPDRGVAFFEDYAAHRLAARLRIDDYVRKHPEVLNQPITAPIFVMGIPRTGTTLSSNLLATDPRRRSLLTWMVEDPVPPARFEDVRSDPRALAALEAERKARQADPAAGRFYMASAVFPTECIFVQEQDFKAMSLEAMGRLPAYREWMLSADMTSAYEVHKRFLQVLQHDGAASWNLKMPSHALHLKYLLKVYPDARLVWTLRDPYTAVGSLCSLISNSHRRTQDTPDDAWIGETYPPQAAEHANRVMAVRPQLGHDRIYDLHYADTMRDPIASMRRLYAWLGDEFTPEVESAMRRWLTDNPQGKWGKHAYKLDQWGLSEATLRPLFADYLSQYDIEREG
jgi:hypothetical protein